MKFEEINELVLKALTTDDMYFEVDGKTFAIAYFDALGVISAWAETDEVSIFTAEDLPDVEAAIECVDTITTRISEYLDGYIHCSNCGKLIKVEEATKLFAGRYCNDCKNKVR